MKVQRYIYVKEDDSCHCVFGCRRDSVLVLSVTVTIYHLYHYVVTWRAVVRVIRCTMSAVVTR